MGFLDNLKEKKMERDSLRATERLRQNAIRANELAHRKFLDDHSEWTSDIAIIRKMVGAFTNASERHDAAPSSAALRKGEYVIWQGQATLHESRRLPGQYVGKNRGISIPIGKTGLRYRTGATKGTFIQGDEVQQMIESGNVLLTTSRLIFNGNINTKEWAFAKWIGAEASNDETDFMFHVSNRQKSSGLSFRSNMTEGHEFNLFLAQALDVPRNEIAGVLKELIELQRQSEENEPKEPPSITAI